MSYFNILIVVCLIAIAAIITFIFKNKKIAISTLLVVCIISGFVLGVIPSPTADYDIVVDSHSLKELKQGGYYSVDNETEKIYVEVTKIETAYTPKLFNVGELHVVILENAPPTLTVAYKKYKNTIKNYLFYSNEVKNSRMGNHEIIEAELLIPEK